MQTEELHIQNASRHAQVFYCKHMTPGLAGYKDETLLVDTEAMKRMAASMVGKPVYIGHQKVDLKKLNEADGFVSDCFYNEVDGCLWAKCLATTDAAHNAVAEKWAVSNAYIPTVTDRAGSYNGVDYKRKVLEGYFTHLAIVPEGKYDEAGIFTPEEFKVYQSEKKNQLQELQNSKNNNGEIKMSKFKLFNKKREEVTNSADLTNDTEVEIENGVTVSIGDMIEAIKADKAAKAAAAEKETQNSKEKLNMDAEVECDDEKMTVGELMNRYTKLKKNGKEKKNADDKDETENEEDDEAAKKKKEEEEKENKEKKNSKEGDLTEEEKKHLAKMREIQNKADKGGKTPAPKTVEISFDRDARGKKAYGSAK